MEHLDQDFSEHNSRFISDISEFITEDEVEQLPDLPIITSDEIVKLLGTFQNIDQYCTEDQKRKVIQQIKNPGFCPCNIAKTGCTCEKKNRVGYK